jgi:hypothetical protein
VISQKHSEEARRNLLKATAANQARIAQLPSWHCKGCGKLAPATAHQLRKTYCSMQCMAQGYAHRMRGENNPNYRNAGMHICLQCRKQFQHYNKSRKFCSVACRNINGEYIVRASSKKDGNHWEIVRLLLRGGAWVRDLSRAFYGVPDLLIWYHGIWSLAEVKNPNTSYGRRGLNKMQSKWANDWQGGPVLILRTAEDVANFLAWNLDKIEREGEKPGWAEVVAKAAKNKAVSRPKKPIVVRNADDVLALSTRR